jgi:hypothetical protein
MLLWALHELLLSYILSIKVKWKLVDSIAALLA